MSYFGEGKELGVHILYEEQKEFKGTAHATAIGKDFVGDHPFFLIYGDLFIDSAIISTVRETYIKEKCSIISALKVEDPTKFGILKTDSQGYLEKIVEKPPDDRYGRFANAGIYVFNPIIFEGISETELSPRGEFELTESIERIIEKGEKVKVVDISSYYWSDVGHPWQFLSANTYAMKKLSVVYGEDAKVPLHKREGRVVSQEAIIEPHVTIHDTVVIGKNTVIKSGTYIEGPVIIGEDCVIGPNAYLRPYTVIGNGCKIGNSSEIKGSIIMDHTNIAHLSYIGDSIIGSHVNIGCGTITANVRLDKKNIHMMIKGKKTPTHQRKLGAFIGDYASLGIQVSIMPGKKIGSHTLIGSHSIIMKDVEKNTIFYGEMKEHSLPAKRD